MNNIKQTCIFCNKEFKNKKLDNTKHGICATCKISMLKTMKKPEYVVMVRKEFDGHLDVKLVCDKVAEQLKGQGYKEIK